jgi:hypothetical protein
MFLRVAVIIEIISIIFSTEARLRNVTVINKVLKQEVAFTDCKSLKKICILSKFLTIYNMVFTF